MRRRAGLVLIGVGAFFIALAPLLRFYVARQVLAAPLNIYETTTLEAHNATYLDTTKLKVKKGATVTAINTTRGDVNAGDSKIAVWDSFTSVEDADTKVKIDTQTQRVAFDRRTAMMQNGRGAQVNNDPSVRQTGVGLFWPIGVKKQSYPYFDMTTKRAWPMAYAGEDHTLGVRTYRFVQIIPPTVTEAVKPGVPISLLGLSKAQAAKIPGYDEKTGVVPAGRVYKSTATAWIDPRTGAEVNEDQKVVTTLRTNDGVDRLVVGNMDLKMTPASVKYLVHRSDSRAAYVGLVRTGLPYGGGVGGIVLVVVGLGLAYSVRRRPAHGGSGGRARRAGGEHPTAKPA